MTRLGVRFDRPHPPAAVGEQRFAFGYVGAVDRKPAEVRPREIADEEVALPLADRAVVERHPGGREPTGATLPVVDRWNEVIAFVGRVADRPVGAVLASIRRHWPAVVAAAANDVELVAVPLAVF